MKKRKPIKLKEEPIIVSKENDYIPNDEELLEIPKRKGTLEETLETVRANGDQIAKAIGGHIPERVLDDGLLKRN